MTATSEKRTPSEILLITAANLMIKRKAARLQAMYKSSAGTTSLYPDMGADQFADQFVYDPEDKGRRGEFARARLAALDLNSTVAVCDDQGTTGDRFMRLSEALEEEEPGVGRLIVTKMGEEIVAWNELNQLRLVTNAEVGR